MGWGETGELRVVVAPAERGAGAGRGPRAGVAARLRAGSAGPGAHHVRSPAPRLPRPARPSLHTGWRR